ncbi:hypothetical protein [Argonema galeatum]|uniref:hypothetical protein n=1 Tax=Argonema galeatum TaxID=2942762 RepID=UPI0020128F7A|nr:hypothetical protein [Argonema galeatum]MCL1463336.1 hypothetical protein [Argonema galeatum A003/A1]
MPECFAPTALIALAVAIPVAVMAFRVQILIFCYVPLLIVAATVFSPLIKILRISDRTFLSYCYEFVTGKSLIGGDRDEIVK